MATSISKKLLSSAKVSIILFLSIHAVNLLLLILVMGFWDGGLSIGFPKAFYVINCGFNIQNYTCPMGFNLLGLIIDILVWYLISLIVKSISKNY